jgi:hypothetical protein
MPKDVDSNPSTIKAKKKVGGGPQVWLKWQSSSLETGLQLKQKNIIKNVGKSIVHTVYMDPA